MVWLRKRDISSSCQSGYIAPFVTQRAPVRTLQRPDDVQEGALADS